MVSEETQGPALGTGAHCNSGHGGVYLAGRWLWGKVNKVSSCYRWRMREKEPSHQMLVAVVIEVWARKGLKNEPP